MSITNRIILLLCFTLLFGCGVNERKEGSASQPDRSEANQGSKLDLVTSSVMSNDTSTVVMEDNQEGVPLVQNRYSTEEKELFLFGAWQLFFPMPANNWGHEFKINHEYSYWDFSREALEERYWYTDGEWRLDGDDIQVRVVAYRISDRDAEEDVLGFRFPLDTEYITISVEDDTWHSIGTMESIRTGIVQNGRKYPPRITLHPLRFNNVLDTEFHYYRDRP